NPLFHDRARETVDWLKREMTTGEGAFCASLDADSEGEEGKFYVWSFAEIENRLGKDDAAIFAEIYDITPDGNFEGHNILNRLNSLSKKWQSSSSAVATNPMLQQARSMTSEAPDFMLQDGRSISAAKIAAMQHILFEARETRIRPGLDDKVLAD